MDRHSLPSRRMFLKAAPAAAVVAALPAAALAKEASPLPDMIAAYDKAAGAFEAAVDEQEAAETRFKATLSPIVALSLGPNGEGPSGGLEYRKFSTEVIEEEIRKTHAQLRECHCGRYVRAMAPGLYQGMSDALDASLAASLAGLADTVRQERQLEDKLGVTAAEQLWQDTLQAESDTVLAVLSYVPNSKHDRRTKAQWLTRLFNTRSYHLDAEMVAALAASIVGKEA